MPKKKIFLGITLVLAIAVVGFLVANFLEKDNIGPGIKEINSSCKIEEKFLKVSGNSLSGFIENGAELKVLMGYYACNPVERRDVVLYSYSSERNPLIKMVKGMPGDKFHLEKSPVGCWNILINGEILKNHEGNPYCFSEYGYKMISLYENDYKGVIPDNAYLIFGNLVAGSKDSSNFGLVGKVDLVGKVIVDNL